VRPHRCRPTRRAIDVPPDEFRKARPGFEAKVRRYEWGLHPTGFAGTTAWILPNPSGLNKAFTLDALVKAYSELRTALRAAPSPRESIMVTDDTTHRPSLKTV
jgi:TDG/mug DNA glycosylase family protein